MIECKDGRMHIASCHLQSLMQRNQVNVMRWYSRQIAILIAVAVLITALIPIAAMASSIGRRNTAIGVTAATIGAIAAHSVGGAIVLGAGSAYAWKRYHDSKNHERYYYYPSGGYGRGYYVPAHKHHGWHNGHFYGWHD